MANKRTLWRTRGVPVIIALFAFAFAACDDGGPQSQDCANRGFCDWGGWVVGDLPTCTAQGTETRACRDCRAVFTSTVPATGHDWGGFVEDYPATCTTNGSETRPCLLCEETYSRPIFAFDHKWCEHGGDGWVTTVYPTDDDPGLQTRPCLNDGCTFIDSRVLGPLVGHCGCDRECCERIEDCDDPRWNCRFPDDCVCPPV